MSVFFHTRRLLTCTFIFSLTFPALALVMKPETSMVMVNEDGGSLNVTNTGDKEALLYVKVYDLPDAKQPQPKLLVTQPVTRVGAGKTQRVRFIMSSNGPLQGEYMKRVIIEGIPPKQDDSQNQIGINIRQDLPVIIHPKALAVQADPWKNLQWSAVAGKLQVSNPSEYVVRIGQNVTLAPSLKKASLSKSYILPGETLQLTLEDNAVLASSNKVTIESMSKYGYEAGKFELPITR